MSQNNWDRVERENRQEQWATNHRSEAAELQRHRIHGQPTSEDESLMIQQRKNQPGPTPTPSEQKDQFTRIWAGHCQVNGCDKVWACALGLLNGLDRVRWVVLHCYGPRYGTLKPERYFYTELSEATKHFDEKVAAKQRQKDRYSPVPPQESGMHSFLTRHYKIIKKEKGIP